MSGTNFPIASEPVVEAVEADCLDRLASASVQHRLAPVLVDVLDSVQLDVPEDIRAGVEADRVQRMRSMSALGRVATALDEAGLQWAVFKGPVVASLMSRPELRRFNDIDILVRGRDLGAAIDTLAEAGLEELNQNWDGYVRHRVGEVPMILGPVNVDLHWHLVGLGVHRSTIDLSPDEMLGRVRRRKIADVEVSVLDPEDQLLHFALHSALSGAQRLDQLRDMAVLTDADPVDWDRFAARAKDGGVARLVAHALDRSRVVAGADVGAEFLRELGGRPVSARRWLDDHSSRPPSQMRAISVTFWRDGLVNTARSLWWSLRMRLATMVGRGTGWDVSDEGGPLHYSTPSGGSEQREAFINGAAVWK